MVSKVFSDMEAHGVKQIGYIGFSDAWGDQVITATKQWSAADRITILAVWRYARTGIFDTALKLDSQTNIV